MPNATPTADTAVADATVGSETLVLPRRLAVRLLHAAQCSSDAEICGLVAASDGQPDRFLPVPNVAAEPAREFRMDDAELVAAMQSIREQQQTLWAVFHSHPSAPAEPSARDLSENGYPEALSLIASLNIKGVLELRAWRMVAGKVVEQGLSVRD